MLSDRNGSRQAVVIYFHTNFFDRNAKSIHLYIYIYEIISVTCRLEV